jgi:8-oxo-dGTP pyrophosphatase MutT (NUDIX family)
VEPTIREAATVILVRDSDAGIEVLVQRRSAAMAFAPGAYAFPGGAIDAEDRSGDDPFRVAAVRELHEEAGIQIDLASLIPWSRWITPPGRTRRFDTWFFLAQAPDGAVVTTDVDHEFDLHAWVKPSELLNRLRLGEVEMLPPTQMTLSELAQFSNVGELLVAARDRIIPFFDGDTIRMTP